MGFKRASGIIAPIFSLDSDYGIGDFGINAYKFVDFLKKSKIKYWQILPLVMTDASNSPYQSYSAFAGNIDFIDLEDLVSLNLLTSEEIKKYKIENNGEVNYKLVHKNKVSALKIAYERLKKSDYLNLYNFEKNSNWIKSFCIFMILKEKNNYKSWYEWEQYSDYSKINIEKFVKENNYKYYYYVFCQYIFYKQWHSLKKYCNKNNIEIIGDIPIYISYDSVDCFSNKELFEIDEKNELKSVSGCPPDRFSSEGQLWGNPIYNWEILKKQSYQWWINRIREGAKLYDVIRLDHFRGFESYYEISSSDLDAKNGLWKKGPGIELFKKIQSENINVNFIAEDLGYITEEVKQLLKDTNFPGMKVMQFAFDFNKKNDYLPHNYDKNCVVYTGTHDNDTLYGYLKNMDYNEYKYLLNYLGISDKEDRKVTFDIIKEMYKSNSNLVISQIQDFLEIDSLGRINIPSTTQNNWKWRFKDKDLTEQLCEKISFITSLYDRDEV